jgi:hypothetical protein
MLQTGKVKCFTVSNVLFCQLRDSFSGETRTCLGAAALTSLGHEELRAASAVLWRSFQNTKRKETQASSQQRSNDEKNHKKITK